MKYRKKSARAWKILSFALAVFLKVYWYRFRKKSESEWEKFWEKTGSQFRELLFELEGLLIKVGQLLSIREDLLPKSFIKQIQDLVDQVPAAPWEEIKKELEKEWNRPIEDILLSIEEEPVASASIGQVYKARLKDGTEAAIKVQRPAIRSIIKTDFRSLAIIFWFAGHFAPLPKGFINFNLLFKELKIVIEREVDFKKEMETSNYFRERFRSFSNLLIPKVYSEFSTSQVLVMEWVDGARITDSDFLEKYQISRKELSEHVLRTFLPQWLEAGFFHADPHAGNVRVRSDGTLILLDFGMVGEISKKDALNFQHLIQAILFKNYANAVDALRELDFLLPKADAKQVEKLLKEVLSIDFNRFKEMDMLAVKKEMNDIMRSLPIQVPTRFIFLGRSFVTIEGMLLTINPDEELIDMIKPVFMEWINKNYPNKWKLVLTWIKAQPFIQMFQSTFTNLVELPGRLIDKRDEEQMISYYFSIYENQKKQVFFLGILAALSTFYGMYVQNPYIWQVSSGVVGLSLFGYILCSWKQRKWLKRK
ncbi:ABC1 kinase family protein [Metabacillus fastidiosus]|uniref:ABC1 kinase family protein n=1 Tax=Metabacillus fastidiosus TaxID=1458 RepID=UPI002E1A965C|nr:AarF/UbiB family protein [Metabacillus fastidiosus]